MFLSTSLLSEFLLCLNYFFNLKYSIIHGQKRATFTVPKVLVVERFCCICFASFRNKVRLINLIRQMNISFNALRLSITKNKNRTVARVIIHLYIQSHFLFQTFFIPVFGPKTSITVFKVLSLRGEVLYSMR